MKTTVYRYWKEILLFAVISAVYTICCSPGLTWAGYGSDIGDFFGAAKYGQVLHAPGHAAYTMLAYIAVRIPIGSEGWRLAYFGSTIPAILSAFMAFIIVRRQTSNFWAPYITAVVLMGSNIYLLQSAIPESYAVSVLLVLGVYWFYLTKRYALASLTLGLVASMHVLGWVSIPIFFIVSKEIRRKWYWFAIVAIAMYAFTFLRGAYGESFSMISGSTFGMLQYVVGTAVDNNKWWFSLPIWMIDDKIWSSAIILSGSFGLGLIAMVMAMKRWRRYSIPLALSIAPMVYYLGCVTDITTKIVFMAAPFLAMLAGFGSTHMNKYMRISVFICSMLLLLSLTARYDIGRSLDPYLSAQATYEQFGNLPDGSIVVGLGKYEHNDETLLMGVSGREQTLLHTYNRYNGTNHVPINISMYVSTMQVEGYGDVGEYYREQMEEEYGIVAPWAGEYIQGENNEVETYWKNIHALWEMNQDRVVYYSTVNQKVPFMRILTPYEGEWKEWLSVN